MARVINQPQFDAVGNGILLDYYGHQQILQQSVRSKRTLETNNSELNKLVKSMCLKPSEVLRLLDSARRKGHWESVMMSRAKIGLACNRSIVGVSFTHADAASQITLMLFDSDFPARELKGTRTVCDDMTNAAQQQLRTARRQNDERSGFQVDPRDPYEIIDRKLCVDLPTKWVKNDFPVFLVLECEQHGMIATIGKQMIGCPGTRLYRGICNILTGTTMHFRTIGRPIFDGFRDVTFNAEWIRLSEHGQSDVGMVNKRSSGTFITREDVSNLTTNIEPRTLIMMTMFSIGLRFVLTATIIATQKWYQQFRLKFYMMFLLEISFDSYDAYMGRRMIALAIFLLTTRARMVGMRLHLWQCIQALSGFPVFCGKRQ